MRKIENHEKQAVIDFMTANKFKYLNVLGYLTCNPETEDIYVEDIANINGVFILAAQSKTISSVYMEGDQGFIENTYRWLSQDKKTYVFSGVSEAVKDFFLAKVKAPFWHNPCFLYYYPEKTIDFSDVEECVGSLLPKHARMVNKYYEYKGPHSYSNIKSSIEKRPSSAYYIDGKPVSWALIHDDYSMGIMYTIPEYRRKGYGVQVSKNLIRQVLERGEVPFVHIVQSNHVSLDFSPISGLRYGYPVHWFAIMI
ncbi:MAG: GNAT family N-acetyltransferase [Clostridia bacterium]|nr:GNAT family N-acetyltransferase [Clostridia bacterium]